MANYVPAQYWKPGTNPYGYTPYGYNPQQGYQAPPAYQAPTANVWDSSISAGYSPNNGGIQAAQIQAAGGDQAGMIGGIGNAIGGIANLGGLLTEIYKQNKESGASKAARKEWERRRPEADILLEQLLYAPWQEGQQIVGTKQTKANPPIPLTSIGSPGRLYKYPGLGYGPANDPYNPTPFGYRSGGTTTVNAPGFQGAQGASASDLDVGGAGAAGAATGAGIGTGIGTAIMPGLGTFIGGAAGALLGGTAGALTAYFGGKSAPQKMYERGAFSHNPSPEMEAVYTNYLTRSYGIPTSVARAMVSQSMAGARADLGPGLPMTVASAAQAGRPNEQGFAQALMGQTTPAYARSMDYANNAAALTTFNVWKTRQIAEII